MAEEPEIIRVEKQEESETRKNLKVVNVVFIVLLVVIILAAQTIVAYFTINKLFFAKMNAEINELKANLGISMISTVKDTVVDRIKLSEYEPTGIIAEFDDIVVNPAGTEGRRYFVLTMSMEVDRKKTMDELLSKTPVVRDALITLLAAKTLDYVTNVMNMDELRGEIMKTTNGFLDKGRVIRVYFTGYVLQ